MLFREIFRLIGFYLLMLSMTLLAPLGLAVYFQYFTDPALHPQPHTTLTFALTFILTLLAGGILYFVGKSATGHLYRREGIAAVILIWFITPIIGGLPFILSGTLHNPIQAYFEAASGFTTTGSTILTAKKYDPQTGKEIPITLTVPEETPTTYQFYGTVEPVRNPTTHAIVLEGIEAVSPALLFWRSLTQWLGGGGIVVLFVAILPALGVGGKMMFQTEVTGPIKDTLTPRIKETAIQLWKIYISLTLLQFLLLIATNPKLPLFDAVNLSFTTISTGGFSVRNDSLAAYHNAWTEWIVTLFMFLGGVNFALYYYAIKGKFYRLYEVEFGLYILIVLGVCGLSTWYLVGTPVHTLTGNPSTLYSFSEAMRLASSQIISAMTSTGFIIANYDLWPNPVQVLLLIVMFVGGMSGSTSGGIKVIRHYILFRLAQSTTESFFQPDAVRRLKIGGKEMGAGPAMMVMSFFVILIAISVLSTLLYVMDGMDTQTALGVTASSINNAGIGFRAAGATSSFAFLSDSSLVLSSFLMILGRLEFFAVLALLIPAFWRKNG